MSDGYRWWTHPNGLSKTVVRPGSASDDRATLCVMEGTKWCARGEHDVPLSGWGKHAGRRDGLQVYCKACMAAVNAETRAKDPTRQQRWGAKAAEKLKSQVIEAYGGACECCGETHPVFLCLDHPDGVPPEHRNADGSRITGGKLYRLLRAQGFPAGYRIFCWNCNAAHEILGRCPHETGELGTPRQPRLKEAHDAA